MNNNDKIGLGTAAIGRPLYINIKPQKSTDFNIDIFKLKGLELLNAAYDRGVRYFDTAPGYGMAERMLIDWVMEKEDVSIEIATKWGYSYVANFDPNASVHEVKDHSLEQLNKQWSVSKYFLPLLKNYQIHSATLETGVLENKEILIRLAELKNKYDLLLGITTTGINQAEVLKRAIDISIDDEILFDVFQVTYNIFDQSIASLAPEISNRKKRLVIKEALANGRVFPNRKYSNYSMAYSLLKELAEKYKVGVDAISLRYCIDSIPIFKVLSGASTEQQLSENLRVNNFQLKEEEYYCPATISY